MRLKKSYLFLIGLSLLSIGLVSNSRIVHAAEFFFGKDPANPGEFVIKQDGAEKFRINSDGDVRTPGQFVAPAEIAASADSRVYFSGSWVNESDSGGLNRLATTGKYTTCMGDNDCASNFFTLTLTNNKYQAITLSSRDWETARYFDVFISKDGGTNYMFAGRNYSYRATYNSSHFNYTQRVIASHLPIGANIVIKVVATRGRLYFDAFSLSKQDIAGSRDTNEDLIATKFIDANNINYFIDPSNISQFNTINADTITATNINGTIGGTYTGDINASHVSSGAFGSATGGGTYSFPSTVTMNGRLEISGTNYLRANSIDILQGYNGGAQTFGPWVFGGNVGIGTTGPAKTLDVVGTGKFSSTANPGLTVGNGSTGYLQVGSSGWYDDGTYFSPLGTKHFYIRGTTPISYIYSPYIYLGSTSGTTTYLRGNNLTGDNFAIPASGNYYFNNGGNVGIGTTGPAAKLDVSGMIRTATGYGLNYGDSYKSYQRNYSVNTATPATLVDSAGNNFSAAKSYRVTGIIASTSTQTGAVALFKGSEASGFTLYKLYEAGTTSNHVEFYLDAGVPKVRLYSHATLYTATVYTEEYPNYGIGIGPELALYSNGSGNIGIGTTAPNAKLEVRESATGGDGTWTKGIMVKNSNATAGEPAVSFNNSATAANYWITGLNQTADYKIAYGTSFTDANTRFVLSTTGGLWNYGYLYPGTGSATQSSYYLYQSGSGLASNGYLYTGGTTYYINSVTSNLNSLTLAGNQTISGTGTNSVKGTWNYNNYNLTGVNHIQIGDGGVNEGLSWADQTWYIDTSPLNRSNAVGNLNLYGTVNNIALWRPTLWVYNAANYTTATAQSNGGLNLTTTGTGHITFNPGGNVGIGTTNPGTYKLYLANGTGSNVATTFDVGYTAASSNFGAIDIYRSGSSTVGDGISYLFSALDSGSARQEYAGISGQIEANTAGTEKGRLAFLTTDNGSTRQEKMRLTSVGNVGLGTTAPGGRLDIKSAGAAGATWGLMVSDSGGNYRFRVRDDGYVYSDSPYANCGKLYSSGGYWYCGTDSDAGGTVTSISAGTGITLSPNPIVATGTVSLDTTYTDNRYVNTAGDTMTGTLNLASNGLTVGTNQMVVSGGNVGIGTAGPAYKLDVAGTFKTAVGYTTYTADGLFNANATPSRWTTPGGNYGILGYSDAGSGQYVPRIGFYAAYAGAPGNQTASNSSIGLEPISGDFTIRGGAGNSEYIRILNSNGNVGIGTTGPGAKLQVYDSKGTDVPIQILTNTNGANYTQGYHAISPNMSGSHFTGYVVGQNFSARNAGMMGFYYAGAGSTSNYLYFGGHSVNDAMVVQMSGSVGVGTTAPGYKLDVQSGQVNASGGFCIAGSCVSNWNQVQGFWTQTGSVMYPNNMSWTIGIGTTAAVDKLQIQQDWFDSSVDNWGGGIRMVGNNPTISFWETDNGASRWMWHLSTDTMNLYRRPQGGAWQRAAYWDSGSNLINSGSIYPSGQGSYYLYADVGNTSLRTNGSFMVNGNIYWGTNSIWLSSWLNQALLTTSSPTFSTVYTGNWFRSNGASGWYSQTYGGGIRMTDSTYVRTYNSKPMAANAYYDQDNLAYYVDPSNGTNSVIVSGNVGVGTTGPGFKMDVQGGYINTSTGFCINGDCKTAWNQVQGYFTQTGSVLYPNSTAWSVGIGTTSPNEKLDVAGSIMYKAGRADNLVQDPQFAQDSVYWSRSGGFTYVYQDLPNSTKVRAARTVTSGIGNTSETFTQTPSIKIDPNKTYRISVWMKGESGGTGGTKYLGVNTFNSGGGEVGIVNPSGTAVTNPYFHCGGLPGNDTWYKMVAYIFPAGTPNGWSVPPDANGNGCNVSSTGKFDPTANTLLIRFYNYSYNVGQQIVLFALPTIEEVSREQNVVAVNNNVVLAPNSGNVGIGTTGPGSKLEVSGDLTMASGGSNSIIMNRAAIFFAGNNDCNAALYSNVSGSNCYDATHGSDTMALNGYNGIALVTRAGGDAVRMYINSSGNVGIGTTGPGAKLHISGGKMGIASTSGGWGQFQLGNTSNAEATMAFAAGLTESTLGSTNPTATYKWIVGIGPYGVGTDKFAISNPNLSSTPALSILYSNGNVGIGTTGPGYKLDVQGGAVNAASGFYWNGQSLDSRYVAAAYPGVFGQMTTHGAFGDFNTDPGYWGWTYVIGTTNAPAHGDSQGGYRLRVGLGSEYGRASYAAELVLPRWASGYLWTRREEGGSWGSWSKISAGNSDACTADGNCDMPGSGIWNSSGNVGIGTTVPGYKLDVVGAVNASTGFYWAGQSLDSRYLGPQAGATANYIAKFISANQLGNSLLYDNGTNVGIGTTGPLGKLDVKGELRISNTSGSGGDFDNYPVRIAAYYSGNAMKIFANSGREYFGVYGYDKTTLGLSGNVGIGLTNPNTKLWVQNGTSSLSTTGAGASEINSSTYAIQVGPVSTRTGTANLYNAGIAFNHLMNYGSTGGNAYFAGPQAWIGLRYYDFPGWERSSLVFATKPGYGGTGTGDDIPKERMVIDPFGKVGIGTTVPGATLDINGNLKIGTTWQIGAGGTVQNVSNSYYQVNSMGWYVPNSWVIASNLRSRSGYLYLGGSDYNAIQGTDSWLRLNQSSQFTSGTYSPLGIRADGGLAAGGYSLSAGETRAATFRVGNTGNYITSNAGYLGIHTVSNEATIGADSSTLYINYRAANGTTVTAYKWNAGTGSSWAQHEIGRLYAYTDIRSPIFYDQDNTGYYVDPTGNTNLAGQLWVAGNVGIGTSGPAGKLNVNQDDSINPVSGSNIGSLNLTHPTSGGMSMITFKSTVNWPSDGGYLAFYDDNNSYNYWGNSGENSALVLGTTNDGQGGASDVVALRSQAAVIADAPSLLVPSGKVGIGTTNPGSYKLDVTGDIHTTGSFVGSVNLSGNNLTGAALVQTQKLLVAADTGSQGLIPAGYSMYVVNDVRVGGNFIGTGADVAEKINSMGVLEAGDVVVAYDNMKIKRSDKAYDRRVVGVISTNPSLIMAEKRDGHLVAMTGTVPAKVVGKVEIGDLLTTSDTAGYAMVCPKATLRGDTSSKPNEVSPRWEIKCEGAIIGKAMEKFSGEKGTINMLVMMK